MASKIRENLYRIVQEALQNVEKHARAHRVEIDLTVKGKHIILKIRDDGKGFNAVTPYETNGIGLLSMRERAELLGGAFRLQSAPGEGCTVEVEVPIP